MQLKDLIKALNDTLLPNQVRDYCPNGLQVEGRQEVSKVVTGVTASLALIEKAISVNADAILVHHGYFWKGEAEAIVGMKKQRVAALLQHDISLLAYHLPIDVHPILGNNAQLGKILSLKDIRPVTEIEPCGIVMRGELLQSQTHAELKQVLSNTLERSTISVGDKQSITQLAWCTGGGQSFIDQVAQLLAPVDAYISGEISEQTTHSAREQNIDYFAAGHHATERYGVKALGEWLSREFALEVEFIDIDNPA